MAFHDPETMEVRPEERLDLKRLEPWLRDNLEGATGPAHRSRASSAAVTPI